MQRPSDFQETHSTCSLVTLQKSVHLLGKEINRKMTALGDVLVSSSCSRKRSTSMPGQEQVQDTSKTPEGRSATFRVQVFFNCCTILCNIFHFLTVLGKGGTSWKPLLFFVCLFFVFCPSPQKQENQKKRWRASRSVATFTNQPTKVLEFVKLILRLCRSQFCSLSSSKEVTSSSSSTDDTSSMFR